MNTAFINFNQLHVGLTLYERLIENSVSLRSFIDLSFLLVKYMYISPLLFLASVIPKYLLVKLNSQSFFLHKCEYIYPLSLLLKISSSG